MYDLGRVSTDGWKGRDFFRRFSMIFLLFSHLLLHGSWKVSHPCRTGRAEEGAGRKRYLPGIDCMAIDGLIDRSTKKARGRDQSGIGRGRPGNRLAFLSHQRDSERGECGRVCSSFIFFRSVNSDPFSRYSFIHTHITYIHVQ